MTVVTKWHYTDWDVRCNTIATKERGGEKRAEQTNWILVDNGLGFGAGGGHGGGGGARGEEAAKERNDGQSALGL